MNAADLAVYQNLREKTCVCGAAKKARQSFCRVDYFRLPRGVQDALYHRVGYPDTFRRACGILVLTEKARSAGMIPGEAGKP